MRKYQAVGLVGRTATRGKPSPVGKPAHLARVRKRRVVDNVTLDIHDDHNNSDDDDDDTGDDDHDIVSMHSSGRLGLWVDFDVLRIVLAAGPHPID